MSNDLDSHKPIGIFDSGLGGLAVVQRVRRLLPGEDILYLGDTARQPYGPRPLEEVRRFSLEISAYLVQEGVKMVVIGCNTASVAGWGAIQSYLPEIPVLDIVQPGVRAVLSTGDHRRIGVWGTEITIASKAYDRLIHEAYPDATVICVACSRLLRLAEKGQVDDKPYLRELAQTYFQPLSESQIDTLVLGCTDLTCI